MDDKLVLTKCLFLLYRERQIGDDDLSLDLVKDCLETIKSTDNAVSFSRDRDVVQGLKTLVNRLVTTSVETDRETLLEEVTIICADEDKLYDLIAQTVSKEMDTPALRRSVTVYRDTLKTYLNSVRRVELFGQVFQKLKYQADKIDQNTVIEEFLLKLDALQTKEKKKDPAIIAEYNMTNADEMVNIIQRGKEMSEGVGILRTGKFLINDMTQGGIRRPSFTMINALKHQNKTGLTREIFREIAMYNVPVSIDPTRKPCMIRICFEDEPEGDILAFYKNIRFAETGEENLSVNDRNEKEMAAYIEQKLSATGFTIFMLRVDGTQWTFRDIFRKVLEYEQAGYEIFLMVLDYLAHVTTLGCDKSGAMGTDLRDLFRRVKNFGAMKNFATITPHQTAPDANSYLRMGTPPQNFVKEIYDKNFYAGSRQLGQEPDLELFIHLVEHQGKTYTSIQRGKHRNVDHISPERRYGLLPFCGSMPAKDDIFLDKPIFYRSLKDVPTEENTDSVSF